MMKLKTNNVTDEIPLYVFSELLNRMKEMKSEMGEYRMVNRVNEGYVLYTTQGMIEIPLQVLKTQFEQANKIESELLKALLTQFRHYV